MVSRRKFLKTSIAAGTILGGAHPLKTCESALEMGITEPVLLSTWNFGIHANASGLKTLNAGGSALDAVEQGVKVIEQDANNTSVGLGGTPDRDGHVTLDACIMDSKGNAGSVCFLQHILHPISVARKVMEETPHVMLAGEGALRFALDQGFEKVDLLTAKSKKNWEQWQKTSDYKPVINRENHDTIGMLALDSKADMAGACTTSGLAYKMHGRVGDSPIIGAGMFVDNEIGGAVATGMGEFVLKTLGSFLVVELMRQGATPQEACEMAVKRIADRYDISQIQVGYLALNKSGETGAYALHTGFNYALTKPSSEEILDSRAFTDK